VEGDKCVACGLCFRLGCPAIIQAEEVHTKTGKHKAEIDPVLCVGRACDMCAQVCPTDAIHASEAEQGRNGTS